MYSHFLADSRNPPMGLPRIDPRMNSLRTRMYLLFRRSVALAIDPLLEPPKASIPTAVRTGRRPGCRYRFAGRIRP